MKCLLKCGEVKVFTNIVSLHVVASVDDIYILIGSANINQRSMDGKRDTEIAMGCYQFQDEDDDHQMNIDEVQAYRLSLWYEHTVSVDELFLEPERLECVERMRSIGDEMWEIYSSEEIRDMEGVHLVSYPVRVTPEGYVKDLIDGVHFPDTNSLVKGKRSKILPPIFTI